MTLADVIEQGTCGVGRIRHVALAACQLPHEIAVDRAEEQLSGFSLLSGSINIIQNPFEFGSGKVGIKKKSGAIGYSLLMAGLAQILAERGGSSVLPDDCIIDRFARLAIPDERRLALIGDTDGGNVSCRNSRALNRTTAC